MMPRVGAGARTGRTAVVFHSRRGFSKFLHEYSGRHADAVHDDRDQYHRDQRGIVRAITGIPCCRPCRAQQRNSGADRQ